MINNNYSNNFYKLIEKEITNWALRESKGQGKIIQGTKPGADPDSIGWGKKQF